MRSNRDETSEIMVGLGLPVGMPSTPVAVQEPPVADPYKSLLQFTLIIQDLADALINLG